MVIYFVLFMLKMDLVYVEAGEVIGHIYWCYDNEWINKVIKG